jgi:hypothetical protein
MTSRGRVCARVGDVGKLPRFSMTSACDSMPPSDLSSKGAGRAVLFLCAGPKRLDPCQCKTDEYHRPPVAPASVASPGGMADGGDDYHPFFGDSTRRSGLDACREAHQSLVWDRLWRALIQRSASGPTSLGRRRDRAWGIADRG